MKNWSNFEKLARIARQEEPAPIDVTAKVMSRIAEGTDRTRGRALAYETQSSASVLRLDADEDQLGLLLGAALAVAAASIALMLGLPAQETLGDPLAGWFQVYQATLQ